MNKFIKVAAVVAAMVVAFCITAFAKTSYKWNQFEDGRWQYVETEVIDGEVTYAEPVRDMWAKDNGKYFYLGSDGFMLINSKVDYETETYYVGQDGAKVINQWILISDEEDTDPYWMYFDKFGKAVNGAQKINEVNYAFVDKKMVTGLRDANFDKVEDATAAAYYYAEDGSRFSGWKQFELNATASYDGDIKWFYFGTNGQKYVDTEKLINGVWYKFDEDGVMFADVVCATDSEASPSYYYNKDGARIKNEWVKKDDFWYYAGSTGNLAKNTVRTINSRKYAFDKDCKMLTGKWELAEVGVRYFFTKDDNQVEGAMATGTVKLYNSITDEFDTYMFMSNGAICEDNYKGYALDEGRLVTPEDGEMYTVFNHKLVNKNGKYVVKAGVYKDTCRDGWWFVDKNGISGDDKEHFTYDEATAKKWKNNL